jgi:hypothetical protein
VRDNFSVRSSAGGHSHAILLQLEREIHAGKKDLALLDAQLGVQAWPAPAGMKQ